MSPKEFPPGWLEDVDNLSKFKKSRTVDVVKENEYSNRSSLVGTGPVVQALECGHLLYDNRPKRIDLVSGKLMGIQMAVNGSPCLLCDVSNTGLSYAKKVSMKMAIDYFSTKRMLDKSAKHLIGKGVKANFTAEHFEDESLDVTCCIRNHHVIYGLSFNELEREFNKFLYFKSIKRGKDKDYIFDKFDQLTKNTHKLIIRSRWNDELTVSVNTTIINLMKEIGATPETFDNMYDGYRDKPIFLKLGASIDNEEERQQFLEFRTNIASGKKPVKKVVKTEKADPVIDEVSEIATSLMDKMSSQQKPKSITKPKVVREVNGSLSYYKFLHQVWKNCLYQLNLDLKATIPKSQNHKLASRLKIDARLFNVNPKLFADSKKENYKRSTELFVMESLIKLINQKGKIDIYQLQTTVRRIIDKTLESCLAKIAK